MYSLEDDGFMVVRGLLSEEEVLRYRHQIQKLSGISDGEFGQEVFACPDGVSKNREFWPLITNPRLISLLSELLGPTVRYTQHSDLHAHRTGGWHRDCACRTYGVGPDWAEDGEPYQVTRVAIYLQSYQESGSSLGVVPGSHRFEQPLSNDEWQVWAQAQQKATIPQRIQRKLGLWKEPSLPERHMVMWTHPEKVTPSFPVWIKTEPGDCVIFDQRLYHSASAIHGPKYAIYLSYSPENQHARNHMGYYRYFRKDLGYDDLDPDLVEVLNEHKLFMTAPSPEHIDGYFANGTERMSSE
jgi:hypothetical protein